MDKQYNTLLVALVTVALLSTGSFALNFGSIVKDDYAKVQAGEDAQFDMLFWNIDEKPYDVRITILDSPSDFAVTVDPYEFTVSSDLGDEYITLPYAQGAKARLVRVNVHTGIYSTVGTHQVTLKAQTILPNSDLENYEVVPERVFKLQVEIEGHINETKENGNIYFYTLAMATIAIVSIVLYKKHK